MRLEEIRGQRRSPEDAFTFSWNGQDVTAYPGETILGALVAAGFHTLRHTRFGHEPRGMLCGIGICYECLVTVDGRANRRACLTPARPGMTVESGAPLRLQHASMDMDTNTDTGTE
jgi:predicted molibdopterin-dependent oxidoreductase YjgC